MTGYPQPQFFGRIHNLHVSSPQWGDGESVSVVDWELLAHLEVGEGDDAVDDAEAGVVEQVELAVRGERVRYLQMQSYWVEF